MAIAMLTLVASSQPSHAQTRASAQYFVAELVGRAVAVIKDKQLSPYERREKFQALIERHFDVPVIAEYVLGRHWNGASVANRVEFTSAFTSYLVAMYAPRVAAYGDVAFTVMSQTVQNDGSLMVASEVARADDARATAIDWRTVQGADGFKITDVVVDGVSLMKVKREEIGAVFDYTRDGMAVLLDGAATLVYCADANTHSN